MTVWCGNGACETPNSGGHNSENSDTLRRLHFFLTSRDTIRFSRSIVLNLGTY